MVEVILRLFWSLHYSYTFPINLEYTYIVDTWFVWAPSEQTMQGVS